jgi:hypothetical protein
LKELLLSRPTHVKSLSAVLMANTRASLMTIVVVIFVAERVRCVFISICNSCISIGLS